ncbi:Cas4 family exonuclease [Gordonia phage Upyo]|nr:Cas4 family exonuclease [Gordonia phage Upyo]
MTSPFADPAGPEVASPFATPGQAPAVQMTKVHQLPLPPETRAYRPSYNHYRQYVLPEVHGHGERGYTRVTTGAKTLDDTTGLEKWKLRSVVQGIKAHPYLLDDVDPYAEDKDLRRTLEAVADRAHQLNGGEWASEFGTAIHAWAEAVELGAVAWDAVPAQFKPHVEAYFKAMIRYGITTPSDPEGRPYVERIVYNPVTDWVGTFDRIYQLADGSWCIGDVKTAKDLSYSYLAISVQLADYADAALILSNDGTRWESMPKLRQDIAVVAWVPSNADPAKADMISIDIQAGRQALEAAVLIREMRTQARSVIPNRIPIPRSAAIEVPEQRAVTAAGGDLEATQTAIRALIRTCTSQEQVAEVFDTYSAVWSDELTTYATEHLQRRPS